MHTCICKDPCGYMHTGTRIDDTLRRSRSTIFSCWSSTSCFFLSSFFSDISCSARAISWSCCRCACGDTGVSLVCIEYQRCLSCASSHGGVSLTLAQAQHLHLGVGAVELRRQIRGRLAQIVVVRL